MVDLEVEGERFGAYRRTIAAAAVDHPGDVVARPPRPGQLAVDGELVAVVAHELASGSSTVCHWSQPGDVAGRSAAPCSRSGTCPHERSRSRLDEATPGACCACRAGPRSPGCWRASRGCARTGPSAASREGQHSGVVTTALVNSVPPAPIDSRVFGIVAAPSDASVWSSVVITTMFGCLVRRPWWAPRQRRQGGRPGAANSAALGSFAVRQALGWRRVPPLYSGASPQAVEARPEHRGGPAVARVQVLELVRVGAQVVQLGLIGLVADPRERIGDLDVLDVEASGAGSPRTCSSRCPCSRPRRIRRARAHGHPGCRSAAASASARPSPGSPPRSRRPGCRACTSPRRRDRGRWAPGRCSPPAREPGERAAPRRERHRECGS